MTAKQREQIKDMPLVGQNPGNVTIDGKGRLRADTELLGGEKGARFKFKELTGEFVPEKIMHFEKKLPNNNLVVYRRSNETGLFKVEITTVQPNGQKIIEKITFQ